jgi:hypothetical protein
MERTYAQSSRSACSSAPTALIIADHDKVVPARRSAPLRQAVSNLVFARTIDAGHNDLYDHPDFAEAMREALAAIEAASVEFVGRGQMRPDQVLVKNARRRAAFR